MPDSTRKKIQLDRIILNYCATPISNSQRTRLHKYTYLMLIIVWHRPKTPPEMHTSFLGIFEKNREMHATD